MFLSKKWILSIIAITGISFMILLVIQFGWIKKSIDINRRHFNDRMVAVTNKIRDAFMLDKSLQNKYLTGSFGRNDLFAGDVGMQRLEGIIKQKLDSVLDVYKMPLSTSMTGRLDSSCYLMYYVPPSLRSQKIDHSPYKICLCSNNYKGSLDIGFDLFSDNMLIRDASGLILPSLILILLLIALFAYIISVVNRQKRLAELKNDFINNLTHEFNTPLFSIGLTSTLLARSESVQQSEKLRGYIELITTEKNRLQTQVDKILRLTAVESVNLITEKVNVDMHDIIRQNII
ncbi:MAG TPA: histidine kinase dimerization/phospho-acceptor domain-containing protein, partial [Puia sp.]|nr:histidine kinase dimerization/phospho-acceptor domain-containing protein [Puia sp.]